MSLKLVLPVTPKDQHLVPGLIKVIKTLGGLGNREVMILATRSTQSQSEAAAEELRECAGTVTVIPWEMDNDNGWPLAPNLTWQRACIEIGKQEQVGNSSPWYFFEADNCPLTPGWLNDIESKYAMSGAKFGGIVAPTRIKLHNGTYTTERNIPGLPENIPHMVGTGIYPANIAKVTRGLWSNPKREAAWDIVLRYEVARNGVTNIDIMENHWGTVNYREDRGVLIGEPKENNPDFSDHSGPIGKNCVLVHGCKDTSLQDIILKRYPLKEVEAASTDEPVEAFASVTIAPKAVAKPDSKKATPSNQIIINTGKKLQKVNYDRGMSRALEVATATTNQIEAIKENKKAKTKAASKKKASRWAALK